MCGMRWKKVDFTPTLFFGDCPVDGTVEGEGVLGEEDLGKAYDHVDWSFLCLVMNKMGFGVKWIR